MTPTLRIRLVPAPASTPGIVKATVPRMLPIEGNLLGGDVMADIVVVGSGRDPDARGPHTCTDQAGTALARLRMCSSPSTDRASISAAATKEAMAAIPAMVAIVPKA
jgi:hypothetical protein